MADAEFKPDLTAKIAALVQRFAPEKRWHCDSLLQARPLCACFWITSAGLLLLVKTGCQAHEAHASN